MQDETNKMSVKYIQPMLVDRFAMEGIDEEKRMTLIQNMTEAVIKRVMIEAFDKLNETDQEAFSNLMDENNPPTPEQVDDFLNEKLRNAYEEIVIQAINELENNIKEAEGVMKEV